jgi:Pectate lyase superfamily protein
MAILRESFMRVVHCLALFLLALVGALALPAQANTMPLITQVALDAPLRNDFGGWVGLYFTTGSTPSYVQSLGRLAAAGNQTQHTVKLVNAQTGVDVPGGSATVNMAGSQPGQFVYGQLPSPITLSANTGYYLVSQEMANGDQWYNYSHLAASSGFSLPGPVYGTNTGYVVVSVPNMGYVPLNLQWTATAPVVAGATSGNSPTSGNSSNTTNSGDGNAVTQATLTTRLRNDYTGFVGLNFVTGASPLSIQALGRMAVAGNSATHTLKLVNAQTGADVPGAAVVVNMTGAPAGQFLYGSLSSAITLAANTSYYLVSQETTGGDQWFDYCPISIGTGFSVPGSVYWTKTGYVPVPVPNTSYVPLTFQIAAAKTSGGSSNTGTPPMSTNPPSGGSTSGDTTAMTGQPVIIHASTSVNAGDTAVLIGDSFNIGNSFGAVGWFVPNSSTGTSLDPTQAVALTVLESSSTSAKVLVPPTWPAGVYAISLWNAGGYSTPVFLNRAEPSWALGDARDVVYPGQNLRVMGRNFGTAMTGSLQASWGTFPLGLVKGNKWSATFLLPPDIPPGTYHLHVNNGMGGALGFANAPTIKVAQAPAAWPSTHYSVTTYGAACDGTTDDSKAFNAALQAAGASGGGVVVIPAGTCVLSQKLFIPSFTELMGGGPNLSPAPSSGSDSTPTAGSTTIVNSSPVLTLFAGTSDFKISNMSILASASHRVIVCPDDPQMYNDWGLGANPAAPCENVTVSNVAIQHTTPDFSLQGYILATRALHFFGNDITVQNSTVHTQGIPTSFFNAHHVLVSHNHLFVGFYSADGFWNANESIYEFNEHAAEPGTSGDGLFVQGTSHKLYFEGNYFHDSLGTYGEGIVAGDSPYQSLWFGRPGGTTVAGTLTVSAPGAGWTSNQYQQDVVYVVSGKGSYQRRYIVSNTSDTLTVDHPWDVPLDSTSYISIQVDHSDGIFYQNRFSNVTAAILLYSQSYGFVVDGNQGDGVGGSTCLGWNYDPTRSASSPSPQRWFNNCYFNEWTNNTFAGSLNASNPNKNAGPIPVLGRTLTGVSEYLTNTAIVGPVLDPSWMSQPLTPGDFAVPIVGNIVRGNTMTGVATGAEKGSGTIGGIYNSFSGSLSCSSPVTMPNGGATDTLVEDNTVTQSGVGALFYPLFTLTLIRNNNFSGDQIQVEDYSMTTCAAAPTATAATGSQ